MESIARSIGIDVDKKLKNLNLGFQLASPKLWKFQEFEQKFETFKNEESENDFDMEELEWILQTPTKNRRGSVLVPKPPVQQPTNPSSDQHSTKLDCPI